MAQGLAGTSKVLVWHMSPGDTLDTSVSVHREDHGENTVETDDKVAAGAWACSGARVPGLRLLRRGPRLLRRERAEDYRKRCKVYHENRTGCSARSAAEAVSGRMQVPCSASRDTR